MAERMAAISKSYVSDSEREESFMQLSEIKEVIKETIDELAGDEGEEKSSGHMALESWINF
jgi:hypothetical protein